MTARTLDIPRHNFEWGGGQLNIGRGRIDVAGARRRLNNRRRRRVFHLLPIILAHRNPAGGSDFAHMKESQHRVNIRLKYAHRTIPVRSRQTGIAVLTDIAQSVPQTLGPSLNLEKAEESVVGEIPEAPVFLDCEADIFLLLVFEAT